MYYHKDNLVKEIVLLKIVLLKIGLKAGKARFWV